MLNRLDMALTARARDCIEDMSARVEGFVPMLSISMAMGSWVGVAVEVEWEDERVLCMNRAKTPLVAPLGPKA